MTRPGSVLAWLGTTILGLALLPAAPAAEKAAPKSKPAAIDASKFPTLQAALDAVPESGGVVTLPPGEFVLTKPLVLAREDTRIEGAGTSTHLRNVNTNGEPALVIRHRDQPQNRRARLWRVHLANFRVTGNTNSGDGIVLQGVDELFIHGVSVERNGGNGISLLDCYEDPRIANNLITYNAKAGLNIVGGHDIVVSGNQFEENQDALRCVDSFNLTMTGNNIDDHLRHGVVIENTYGSVLSGNMIEECEGTAIILDRDCYGITISANVIAHNLGGGVDLRDAWGCAVSANTFVLVHNGSIRIGPDSGRVAITGNSFGNSHIGGKDKRPATAPTPMGRDEGTGILLNATSDIVITGNTFTGLSEEAVRGTGECRRVIVTSNVIADFNRRAAKKLPAINLGKARESIVKDNAISNGAPKK